MQLYFVRHGESEANLARVFSNRDAPHALTERGRTQVEALAEKLQDIHFGAFYASPILRARQSADILAARLGIDYQLTPALLEYDVGSLEGHSDDVSWQRYDDLLRAWLADRRWEQRIDGGESFEEMRERFMPLIEAILHANTLQPTLLLGHGGTFRCMLPLILRNVDFCFTLEHGIEHTEYVLAETRGGELVCMQWGDLVL